MNNIIVNDIKIDLVEWEYEIGLLGIPLIYRVKHPLQPKWVRYTSEVLKFLHELDVKRIEMEYPENHYPPYIAYYNERGIGGNSIEILYSKWYNNFQNIYISEEPIVSMGLKN